MEMQKPPYYNQPASQSNMCSLFDAATPGWNLMYISNPAPTYSCTSPALRLLFEAPMSGSRYTITTSSLSPHMQDVAWRALSPSSPTAALLTQPAVPPPPHLEPLQQQQLTALFEHHSNLFSQSEDNIGCTPILEHIIEDQEPLIRQLNCCQNPAVQ